MRAACGILSAIIGIALLCYGLEELILGAGSIKVGPTLVSAAVVLGISAGFLAVAPSDSEEPLPPIVPRHN